MKIESHAIPGPAGRLEALLNLPSAATADAAGWAAVVCHPHPLFGGTMHNKVVFHVARSLSGLGWPVLRFNYRGVGASAGHLPRQEGHDALLRAAAEDLVAVLDWTAERFPGARVCGAGFSFGAHTLLLASRRETRVARLLCVGTPAREDHRAGVFEWAPNVPQPNLFVQGEEDEFGPPQPFRQLYDAAASPKRLVTIPGAGHFFDGHLDELRQAAGEVTGAIGTAPALIHR